MRKRIQIGAVLTALMFALGPNGSGQTSMGGVSGTVRDQSGAAVPEAKVALVNSGTNERREQSSSASGSFNFPAVPPGAYRLEVEMGGFKRAVRDGLQLRVQQFVDLDVNLELGQSAQSVEVKATVELLDSTTSSVGQIVENRMISELPLNGRNTLGLIELTTGIRGGGAFGENPATVNYVGWGNFSANGGFALSNEVLVDGAPVTGAGNQVSYIPPVDATEEFRVQTSNFSAEFGRSGGAVVNLSVKSGTNRYRGSVYEFLRNRSLDANNFFQNTVGNPKPALTMNQFGASLGGPVRRDKLFFFGNYEGFRQSLGRSVTATVPTALERGGDFSQSRNPAGQVVAVADPLTTRQVGSTYTRELFAGNRIPASRRNPVTVNLMNNFWSLPNNPGVAFTAVNNLIVSAPQGNRQDQGVGRLDANPNAKLRLYGTYSRQRFDQGYFNPFQSLAQPLAGPAEDNGTTNTVVSATWIATARLIGEFRTGFMRFTSDRIPPTLGFDLTSIGFPRAFANSVQFAVFPSFTVTGMTGVAGGSSSSVILRVTNNWSESASFTLVRSRHTLKFGAQYRVQQLNDVQNNVGSGNYAFNTRWTTVDPGRALPTSGIGIASFLLGYPASGNVSLTERLADQRKYYAAFVQNDWRASSRLTLNLGLHYSVDGSVTERFNRKAWFDPQAVPPIAAKTGLRLRGGLRFADSNNRAPEDNFYTQFGPRAGFAFQLNRRTVVRSGYGISWVPRNLRSGGTVTRSPAWTVLTSLVTTVDGGLTPHITMSNPVPDGLIQPPGSKNGLDTLIGQNVTVYQRDYGPGYMQQWNFGIQREIRPEWIIEASYVGSKGTGLPGQLQANRLPYDIAEQDLPTLNQRVPNPFAPYVQEGTLAQPTIVRNQFFMPYPQFTGVLLDGINLGSSTYHSLQTRMTRRFSRNSLVNLAYTLSKGLTDTEALTGFLEPSGTSAGAYMDSYNRSLDKSLMTFDNTHRLVVNYVYAIPYSPRTGALRWAFGGWQASGVYTLQSGSPLFLRSAVGGARPSNTGRSAKLEGDVYSRLERWFDTGVFTAVRDFRFGNTSRTLPDVRNHHTHNLDAGISKNFRLRADGGWTLQFRGELFNALNRVRFGYPGMQFGGADFGVISTQINRPRQVQLALKAVF